MGLGLGDALGLGLGEALGLGEGEGDGLALGEGLGVGLGSSSFAWIAEVSRLLQRNKAEPKAAREQAIRRDLFRFFPLGGVAWLWLV